MHDQSTPGAPSAGGSTAPAGSLVFHPKRPPAGWRRVAETAGTYAPLALLAIVLWSGSPSALTIVAAALIVAALLFQLYAAIGRRRSGTSRYDPRDEVTLSAELVAEVRALKLQDRRSEAWDRVSTETGLGLGDTVRALELIDATIPPGTPRVKARWGGLGASR